MTSCREAPLCFSRFLTSARSRRASAAFASAAARCSGVRGGSATPSHLSGVRTTGCESQRNLVAPAAPEQRETPCWWNLPPERSGLEQLRQEKKPKSPDQQRAAWTFQDK